MTSIRMNGSFFNGDRGSKTSSEFFRIALLYEIISLIFDKRKIILKESNFPFKPRINVNSFNFSFSIR